MESIQTIRIRQLQGELGAVVYELSKVQYSQSFSSASWHPDINAYRCKKSLAVCVDLAGVEKGEIDLRVEPGRLLLRGRRQAPEPSGADLETIQILAMEINYGPFEREIILPEEVRPEDVTAEQRNGFLWVYLPFHKRG